MRTPTRERETLASALATHPADSAGRLCGPREALRWSEVAARYGLRNRDGFKDQRVVLAVEGPEFIAALIDLDGFGRRIVLCPPDIDDERLAWTARETEADAVIAEGVDLARAAAPPTYVCGESRDRVEPTVATRRTEWILFTSGTSGRPKLAVHTLASLAGGFLGAPAPTGAIWSTFYDMRRYGGLQILLRALASGGSFVLGETKDTLPERLALMGRHGATHVSGTPSHWRAALMSGAADRIAPRYIRLSGEIVDQAVLDALSARWPSAQIVHAFASTEAGLAFEVGDRQAGVPSGLICSGEDMALKICDGTLRVRSPRCAQRYLNADAPPLQDEDGFVDTGDVLETRGGRLYFLGRRGGVINIGGLKVHPEEIETVINGYAGVSASRVRPRANPILGSIVVADVVLDPTRPMTQDEQATFLRDLDQHCRRHLSAHKSPAAVRIVKSLDLSAAGKLARHG